MRHQPCKRDRNARAADADRIILNLTISGARERLMNLLDQMEQIDGFAVLDGSFQSKGHEDQKPP